MSDRKPLKEYIFFGAKPSGERYLSGARVFVLFASFAGLAWAMLYFFMFNAPKVACVTIVGSIIGFIIFGLSFRIKNGEIISNISILDFVVTLTMIEYFTGGIESPNAYWLLIIPVVAFFFAGLAKGVFWSMIVAAIILFFEYLETQGIRIPSPVGPNDEHLWMFIKMFSAYLIMVAITLIYEYSRVYFEKKLADKAAELSASQDRLQTTLVDLNSLNENLRKLNSIKSEFTAMVSHELRTPLTAIIQGVKIVLDEKAGAINDEQRSFLEITNRNIERLSRLVNDVLDFQNINTGRMSFYMQKHDLNGVVLEVANDMANVAREKSLNVEIDLSPGVTEVVFDKDKIIQVLTNLLSNSIKYTSTGGITVSTRKEGDAAIVSVKDTGIGIHKEDTSKLFVSFTQLERGRAQKPGGSGLGLAISKKIIEAHRGEIWVESEIETGSTFSFSLPLIRKDRVIMIDPDQHNMKTGRGQLEFSGLNVVSTEGGLKGLELITRNSPDLIILDMDIKDISGIDFMERLWSLEEFISVPVLITATSDEIKAVTEKYKDNKGLFFLVKPFDLWTLQEKVESVLKGKRKDENKNH